MKLKIICSLLPLIILAGCVQKNIEKNQPVTINNKNYTLEISRTEEQREKGLGGRKSLGKSAGMIFLFSNADYLTFWMKNTLTPLQILFVDGCKIVDEQEMMVEADSANPQVIYKSKAPADKAIELNKNTVPENVVGQNIEQLCQ